MSRLKFAQKLVVITALASALVWLLFGGVFFLVAKHSLENQLTDYQVAAARDLMRTIDRSLFAAHQGIQVLAQDPVLNELLASGTKSDLGARREAISDHLENISLLTGPWQVVSLLDQEGSVLASNMPAEVGRSITEHPEMLAAFEAGLDGRLYVSDVKLVGQRNAPSLVFAAPVQIQRLDETKVAGVVVAQYAWPVVAQLLDSVAPHIKVQLLRRDGMIIGTRSVERDTKREPSMQWQALQEAGFASGSIALPNRTTEADGAGLVVAVRQSGHLSYLGAGWVLTTETPNRILLAPVYTLGWQLALAVIAGVLLLCVVLYAAARFLTRPLGAISRAVNDFSQGDLSVRIKVDDHERDDIAELARAFNTMAEDIGFYIEQTKENAKEVQSFAYIVSHDLRSPLVNLKGFSAEIGYSIQDLKGVLAPVIKELPEPMQRQYAAILEKDIPEALQFISSSVQRMDGQIQAVLKLSRLGRRELNWEQVNMGAVVNQVLSSLQHQVQQKNVTVEVGQLPVVEADALALQQILGNLLDNAIKYMDKPAGKIEIACECQLDRQEIVVHVRDNGPGIDAVNIPKAFELFRRVGRADTPGEGMGLPYVKALVRRHGGRIWCSSVVGEGSTFSFSLAKKPSLQVRAVE